MPLKPFDSRVIAHLVSFALPNLVDINCYWDGDEVVSIVYLDSTNSLSTINVSMSEYEKAVSKLDTDSFTHAVVEHAMDKMTSQLIDSQYDS